jgi:polyisoprenoid-binding protein YceI
MNRLITTILFFISSQFIAAQNYRPVDEGSTVHFTIKNFGINTGGSLSGLKGRISFDPSNIAASIFDVSVDVKTINTDIENRDEHLRGENYFDADKYPQIIIKSTQINIVKPGVYSFSGTLTMRGVTKNIVFPFTATSKGDDYIFSGDFEINRLDYSVGESSAILNKNVKISLSVLAKKG